MSQGTIIPRRYDSSLKPSHVFHNLLLNRIERLFLSSDSESPQKPASLHLLSDMSCSQPPKTSGARRVRLLARPQNEPCKTCVHVSWYQLSSEDVLIWGLWEVVVLQIFWHPPIHPQTIVVHKPLCSYKHMIYSMDSLSLDGCFVAAMRTQISKETQLANLEKTPSVECQIHTAAAARTIFIVETIQHQKWPPQKLDELKHQNWMKPLNQRLASKTTKRKKQLSEPLARHRFLVSPAPEWNEFRVVTASLHHSSPSCILGRTPSVVYPIGALNGLRF